MIDQLALEVPVRAAPGAVFAAITDWPAQGRWMTATTVRAERPPGHGAGARLEAWTGVGPLGFLDTMVITRWEPPGLVEVLHTGAVVRGTGLLEVLPAGTAGSGPAAAVLRWTEDLEIPLGALGAVGWRVLRPAFAAGVARSLRELARLVERGELGGVGQRP